MKNVVAVGDMKVGQQSATIVTHALGSCPQTALSFQADFVREQLGIAPSNKLLFGISFGYPDPDAPANRCRTDRAQLSDTVTFHT